LHEICQETTATNQKSDFAQGRGNETKEERKNTPFGSLTLLLGETGTLNFGKGRINNFEITSQIAQQRAILELDNQSKLIHFFSKKKVNVISFFVDIFFFIHKRSNDFASAESGFAVRPSLLFSATAMAERRSGMNFSRSRGILFCNMKKCKVLTIAMARRSYADQRFLQSTGGKLKMKCDKFKTCRFINVLWFE
jgi:hypothetical protein